MTPPPSVALYFDPDGYTESPGRGLTVEGAPRGIMGRQVAGHEFLDAYLTHGRWDTLTAVVRSRQRADPLVAVCQSRAPGTEGGRRLRIVPEAEFLTSFATPDVPANLLYFPCPPDVRFAWARQAIGSRYALCGVTHSLPSVAVVEALGHLIVAPFESFDALICTSRAAADMVRAVTGSYADYLRDRFGGDPRLRPRLAVIPLGVNTNRFRPATPHERAAGRARLGVADDEVLVLCVGRLSHHAKAQPYPLFRAAEQAARRTGNRVRLVFAGWAAHPAIDRAYREGATQFTSSARVAFVDIQDPTARAGAWQAADIFLSLPDNLQETFGLAVIEGMASGLPVIGSDWDGYRDLIVDGETGYLVPSRMVRGATAQCTTRLVFGSVNYDHFVGECAQATAVDPAVAADALTRLVADADLRRRMGAAGRERAVHQFSWERVIRGYEDLWAEQEREVRAWKAIRPLTGPAMYPAPEQSFAGYPTVWLSDADRVQATGIPADVFLRSPLTNFVGDRRSSDPKIIATILEMAAPAIPVRDLATELECIGLTPTAARATIAWLLKYGLLR
jgi:glycosyltransferase involved in cell wall biosynthesis